MQQEFTFTLSELKLEQVFWSFNQVVDLVFSGVLDDNPVVHVQVIVKPEDVHPRVVDHVCFV